MAGLARALQSAYDEELAEAAHARDAGLDGLSKAEAMEQAARALGRDELATRLREVIEQLTASIADARQRLEELGRVEESIRHRFAEGHAPAPPPREFAPSVREITPPAPSAAREPIPPAPRPVPPREVTVPPASPDASPSAPLSVAPPAFPQPDFADEEQADPPIARVVAPAHPSRPAPPAPDMSPDENRPRAAGKAGAPPPRAPPPSPAAEELRAKVTQLGARVLEIEKAAAKMGRALLKLAIEEHIALARLLSERLRAAGLDGPAETRAVLERLEAVAAAAKLTPVFGLQPDEYADWGKAAAEARSQRLALTEARRRDAAAK